MTHLAYTQTYGGVAAYDNVLLANVAGDGRLLNVGGAAVSDLRVPSVTPDLTAAAALAAAMRDVDAPPVAPRARQGRGAERPTRFSNGDTARLTLFNDGATTRLAWRLELTGEHDHVYEIVVDAASGRVLKRRSLTEFATARVYTNHPGAANGGTRRGVTLDPRLAELVDDSSAATTRTPTPTPTHRTTRQPQRVGSSPGDAEIAPELRDARLEPPDHAVRPGRAARPPAAPGTRPAPSTRVANRNQAATQLFYFVNTFHDHLAAAPIGFTHAARNFELNDADGANVGGRGGDPVMAETDNYLNPDAPARPARTTRA